MECLSTLVHPGLLGGWELPSTPVQGGHRMKLHGNAALSWSGRRRLAERVVDQGWTLAAAAEAAGVSVRCAGKWVGRYRLDGELGLRDRSSAPKRVANRTASERVEAIAKLRRLPFTPAAITPTPRVALSSPSPIPPPL